MKAISLIGLVWAGVNGLDARKFNSDSYQTIEQSSVSAVSRSSLKFIFSLNLHYFIFFFNNKPKCNSVIGLLQLVPIYYPITSSMLDNLAYCCLMYNLIPLLPQPS